MRVARGFGAAIVISLAFAGGVAAETAQTAQSEQNAQSEQMKAAREVIEVAGVADPIRNIVPIFLDEGKRAFTRTHPDLSKDLDEAIKTLLPEFEKRHEQLLTDIASVYAQRFSLQELQDIKAFYSSPTGSKLAKLQPGLLQASYEKTSAWSRAMSQDVVTRLREEMKKKGHDI